MSKTIEDYRNIVKILKLELLKIRDQNSTLANQLGIASESQRSSFSPRLEQYKQVRSAFAKNALLFTTFAHKCQLIGVTPQMVFRIADKQRDKKVVTSSFGEVIKRLKLRMSQVQVSQLLNLLTKSASLFYEEYLQFLSAFQINSQKHPTDGSRSYTQLSLIKLGKEAKEKGLTPDNLFRQLNKGEDKPYLEMESLTDYARKNFHLKDVEIAAIFVGLDIHNECKISKETFRRQMTKVEALVAKGVNLEEPLVPRRDKKHPVIENSPSDQQDIKMQVETGVEAGNKKTKKTEKKVNTKTPVPLAKGNYSKLIGQMKKSSIRIQDLLEKLLKREEKRNLVKSFHFWEFAKAVQQINSTLTKKKALEFFQSLDSGSNGSCSTQQMIKLWLHGREGLDSCDIMYKLLYRHFREIQFPDPITRFHIFSAKTSDPLTPQVFAQAFSGLQLSSEQIGSIISLTEGGSLQEFSEMLKAEGKRKSQNPFEKIQSSQFTRLNAASKKLVPRDKQSKCFKKFRRLDDGTHAQGEIWNTIFTDEWVCFDFCLETASKLENFWRDPEFGPTKGDPHGYRSIVGNESNPPPGLPDEEEVEWYTYEEILAKQRVSAKVTFMKENLSANDVVQGKLGNCWFVSALSIIANNDEYIRGKQPSKCRSAQDLLYGVHPVAFSLFRQWGLYVFKFFKKFEAVYVVVDDLFPVQKSSMELIFAKSPDPGLQWVSFLEKAYSKLHHAYTNMVSGDIAQGLNDLTGALPIKQDLENDNPENILKIQRFCQEQQLMGCSISAPKGVRVEEPVELEGQRCGLFYGHAYSIHDFIDLHAKDGENFQLVRVRNPWGHGEWILDWSDKPIDDDPEYAKLSKYQQDLDNYYEARIKEAQQKRMERPELYKPGDDGEFLMKAEDWNKIYSNLFTGFFFKGREYQGQMIEEEWNSKMPSGLCKVKNSTQAEQKQFIGNNHQYVMSLKKETDILMLLSQQDGRLYRGQTYPYKQICNGLIILVFTLQNNEQMASGFSMQRLVLKSLKVQLRRDVDLWHRFASGRYALIPCKMKNKIASSKFEFRIYSDQDIDIKKVNGPPAKFKTISKPQANYDKPSINLVLEEAKKH